MLHPQTTINCKGQILDLSSCKIMGILNVTPDSFFDGGRYMEESEMLQQVGSMLKEGADIIDVGGMSSRPGASIISEEEELRRVIPVIQKIVKKFPEVILSIDTFRATVAQSAIDAGAAIINDISAGNMDERMFETVSELQVPYIMMHMKGNPETMQDNPTYENVMKEILDFFVEKLAKLRLLGVHDVILDPGYGFGKTIDQNYQILKNQHVFKLFDLPILTGVSRKSMIWKMLEINPEEALNGSTALHMLALQQGASILRVHDVKAAKECVKLWEFYESMPGDI